MCFVDVISAVLALNLDVTIKWMKHPSGHCVCLPNLWYDHNLLCVFSTKSWIIYHASGIYLFFVCVCLCWRKAESQYSREITSCHNYKCWGLCAVQSVALQRWAVSRPWVKAESSGSPYPAGARWLKHPSVSTVFTVV